MIKAQDDFTNALSDFLDRKKISEIARSRSMVYNRACGDIDMKIAESRENSARAKVYDSEDLFLYIVANTHALISHALALRRKYRRIIEYG